MRDDVISKIASLLREILPAGATEIVLEGEADEGWSSATFAVVWPDGAETTLGPDEHPGQADEISALLIRLWEADEASDPWHDVTVTVRRDGEPEVDFSAGEPLSETDEIIESLAVVLREVLPDDAVKIVLDGELDEDWSSHDLTMYREDGTSYHIDWDDAPESLDDIADYLIDLFEATTEDGDDPWYGITMTVRRDDTFEINFSYEPLEKTQD
ncbi:immunity protein YezG family protein [Actinoplanes couchii]|uniref:Uncharacterized protein n=1 Tax=Actinoplanes couchii TaxID=403638 RepID=A0ABQ3XD08_9ACTN|nr:immunity protein YezG family protein [Actinoplanes couchii]MDR6321287.1 hypothetical protein [Actinoplanes couchii]GID56398.1 hypothetical protein Aco03nite_048020 [Actinoplanes couchii]